MFEKEESPEAILTRLVLVTFVAILVFFVLAQYFGLVFKIVEDRIDKQHPLGSLVLLCAELLGQSLIWGVVAAVPVALVRPLAKCFGAWFDYAMRVTASILIAYFALYCVRSTNHIWGILVNKKAVSEALSNCVEALVALDFVVLFASPTLGRVEWVGLFVACFGYFLLLTLYLIKIYLQEKEVNIFVAFFLVAVTSFFLAFCNYIGRPLIPTELRRTIVDLDLWRTTTKVSLVSLFQIVISWCGFLFCVILLKIVSKDKEDYVVEVAAPVLKSPSARDFVSRD